MAKHGDDLLNEVMEELEEVQGMTDEELEAAGKAVLALQKPHATFTRGVDPTRKARERERMRETSRMQRKILRHARDVLKLKLDGHGNVTK